MFMKTSSWTETELRLNHRQRLYMDKITTRGLRGNIAKLLTTGRHLFTALTYSECNRAKLKLKFTVLKLRQSLLCKKERKYIGKAICRRIWGRVCGNRKINCFSATEKEKGGNLSTWGPASVLAFYF